jgi:hypothetical protein
MCLDILAFDDLAECSLAKDIQDHKSAQGANSEEARKDDGATLTVLPFLTLTRR